MDRQDLYKSGLRYFDEKMFRHETNQLRSQGESRLGKLSLRLHDSSFYKEYRIVCHIEKKSVEKDLHQKI